MYFWIFIIVFPVVFLLQIVSQRHKVKKNNEQLTKQHILQALLHTTLLTVIAYVAYFLGLAFNA